MVILTMGALSRSAEAQRPGLGVATPHNEQGRQATAVDTLRFGGGRDPVPPPTITIPLVPPPDFRLDPLLPALSPDPYTPLNGIAPTMIDGLASEVPVRSVAATPPPPTVVPAPGTGSILTLVASAAAFRRRRRDRASQWR
jgi:hypothetical protein